MKKGWKIFSLIILGLVITIIFVVSNFNHNINDPKELNLLDCSSPSSTFIATEECILNSFQNCIPATNYNGFHILGKNGNVCRVILGSSEQNLYKCSISINSLSSYDEEGLINLISNLNSNKNCNKIGFSSMLFTRIWD